jgi:hypothetical protein
VMYSKCVPFSGFSGRGYYLFTYYLCKRVNVFLSQGSQGVVTACSPTA